MWKLFAVEELYMDELLNVWMTEDEHECGQNMWDWHAILQPWVEISFTPPPIGYDRYRWWLLPCRGWWKCIQCPPEQIHTVLLHTVPVRLPLVQILISIPPTPISTNVHSFFWLTLWRRLADRTPRRPFWPPKSGLTPKIWFDTRKLFRSLKYGSSTINLVWHRMSAFIRVKLFQFTSCPVSRLFRPKTNINDGYKLVCVNYGHKAAYCPTSHHHRFTRRLYDW